MSVQVGTPPVLRPKYRVDLGLDALTKERGESPLYPYMVSHVPFRLSIPIEIPSGVGASHRTADGARLHDAYRCGVGLLPWLRRLLQGQARMAALRLGERDKGSERLGAGHRAIGGRH